MIFVQGWIKLPPESTTALVDAAAAMTMATRAEAGCLHYSFARDIVADNLFHIIERWQDEAALAAHFQTDHMATFNGIMAQQRIEAMDVRLYAGEEVRVLMQS